MKKEEFIIERTRIISEMLDNPDNYGIYQTTKCFNELDALFDKVVNGVDTRNKKAEWLSNFIMKIYKFKDEESGNYAFIVAKNQDEAVTALQKTTSIPFKFMASKKPEELNKPIVLINNILLVLNGQIYVQ